MKEIRLENFRCYSDQLILFRPGINLLIGDNASGKTSVLKACKYVLSAFFSGFSDENTKWLNPDVDDFTQIEHNGIILPEKPITIHFNIEDTVQYPELLERSQSLIEVPVQYSLQKNSKKNSRSLITGIKEYKEYATLLHKNLYEKDSLQQQKALPLFACFSTEDIHATRKLDANKFIKYAQKSSFGYYECLDGNGFFPYWVKRLLVLKEGNKNLEEIEIVRQAIIKALGETCNIIRDIEIRPNQKKVYYILTDGREVEANYLSDGHRRLVNIVTDLAFRCALLNRGIYGLEACSKTKGTVLIDEIDLHLHPSLQACVFKALRKAFPELQFIATTHAPMVMSGIESNEENIVYKLRYSASGGYKIDETQTYGMDSSTITNIILEQTPRDANVNKELELLFGYIDEDQYKEAQSKLSEMREKFGDNLPELSKAESMLNFMMDDNEDDNEE